MNLVILIGIGKDSLRLVGFILKCLECVLIALGREVHAMSMLSSVQMPKWWLGLAVFASFSAEIFVHSCLVRAVDIVPPGQVQVPSAPAVRPGVPTRYKAIKGTAKGILDLQSALTIVGGTLRLQAELATLEPEIDKIMPARGGVLIAAYVDDSLYPDGVTVYRLRTVQIIGAYGSEQEAEKDVDRKKVVKAPANAPRFPPLMQEPDPFKKTRPLYIWRASASEKKPTDVSAFSAAEEQLNAKRVLKERAGSENVYQALRVADQQVVALTDQIASEQAYLDALQNILEAKAENLSTLKRQVAAVKRRVKAIEQSAPEVEAATAKRSADLIASLERQKVAARRGLRSAEVKLNEELASRTSWSKPHAAQGNFPELLSEDFWRLKEREYETRESLRPLAEDCMRTIPTASEFSPDRVNEEYINYQAGLRWTIGLYANHIAILRARVVSLTVEVAEIERALAVATDTSTRTKAAVEQAAVREEATYLRLKEKVESVTRDHLTQTEELNTARQEMAELRTLLDEIVELQTFLRELVSTK
jgi:hypothetical protein